MGNRAPLSKTIISKSNLNHNVTEQISGLTAVLHVLCPSCVAVPSLPVTTLPARPKFTWIFSFIV